MAKDRIVSANQQAGDAPVETTDTPRSLRPTRLDGFTGQSALCQRLRIALDAARQRNEPMEHLLLHGPPGLGKTTLAHVVANEMDSRVFVTSGPALTRGSDLVGTLTRMQPRVILFIDEIHRLPVSVEEYIYPAMEDFKIDFTLDSGMHAKVVSYQLKPFTLIGATTRAGLLTSALRSRFGISHRARKMAGRPVVHTGCWLARRGSGRRCGLLDGALHLLGAAPARRARTRVPYRSRRVGRRRHRLREALAAGSESGSWGAAG